MPDTTYFRDKLEVLRNEMTQRMNAIDKDARHEGMSTNWTEQATERENDEVLDSLGNASKSELLMIDNAIKRMETNEYFVCSACGNDISLPRLELLPYTNLCIDCAEKQEH